MKYIYKTSEKEKALEFLKEGNQNLKVSEENSIPILALVEEGKIQIGNPKVYDLNAPIFKLQKFNYEDREVILNWYSNINKNKREVLENETIN